MLGVEAYRALEPQAAVGRAVVPMATSRAAVPLRPGRLFPAASRRSAPARPVLRAALKRLFDVAGALGLAVALLPVLLVITALVKADGGPVLFAHERVGRGGRRFGCLKFRSMVTDSQARLAALLAADPAARAEWEATRKLKEDPRVTRIGRFLRKTSLDELPQLVNVIRGEMSLVGPRPTSFDVSTYALWQTERVEFRPGITGPWQVYGRNSMEFDERCRLEISYFRKPSIRREMWLIFATFGSMLRRTGVA